MARILSTKMQKLDVRHPGLMDKVNAMFAEVWPNAEIRQIVQAQYGECLSLSSLEKYKRKHWQARRDLVVEMSQAIGPLPNRVIEPSGHLRIGHPGQFVNS